MNEEEKLLQFQKEIGYTFSDPSLLGTALRHSSYLNEHGMAYTSCNERLEYLGDAVLELVSSRFLFQAFPDSPEGELTRMRAALVCEPALAETAAVLHLGDYLQMGRGEDKTGGRSKPSILSDAVEAVIGALYLDGGPDTARVFIEKYILNDPAGKRNPSDHKTRLQEELQKNGTAKITYRTVEENSADGLCFRSEVIYEGAVLGSGRGRSKKEAEQAAACKALQKR